MYSCDVASPPVCIGGSDMRSPEPRARAISCRRGGGGGGQSQQMPVTSLCITIHCKATYSTPGIHLVAGKLTLISFPYN